MPRATQLKLILFCPHISRPAESCGSGDTMGEAQQGYFGMFWLLILPPHPWLRGVCGALGSSNPEGSLGEEVTSGIWGHLRVALLLI